MTKAEKNRKKTRDAKETSPSKILPNSPTKDNPAADRSIKATPLLKSC